MIGERSLYGGADRRLENLFENGAADERALFGDEGEPLEVELSAEERARCRAQRLAIRARYRITSARDEEGNP